MAKARAHQLFSVLAADLAKFTPNFPGQIGCPLCLRVFPEEALDLDEPLLTEEHIIPEELGGSLLTLTCKTCNNTHGSKIDSHLIQKLRTQDAIAGVGTKPFRGRIEIGGNTVPTDIDWKASVNETTTFKLRQFNPEIHEAIRQSMKGGSVDKINLTMMFDYIPLRACLGVFRIAYLSMFQKLGYFYVLSPAAKIVSRVIRDFENPPMELAQIVGEASGIPVDPERPIRFQAAADDTAVTVIITLVADTTRHYVTFMPSTDLPAAKVLSTLCDVASRTNRRRAT